MTFRLLYNATSAKVGGGLSYALQQVRALDGETQKAGVSLTVWASPWNADQIRAAVSCRVVTFPAPNAGVRFLLEQTVGAVATYRYDACIHPGNFAPILGNPRAVLILQNPNYVGSGTEALANRGLNRRLKIGLFRASARRAAILAPISNHLADEVTRSAVPATEISLLLSGRPEFELPDHPPDLSAWDLVAGRYLLSVANDYPHKRLTDIARAFQRAGLDSDVRLVFVGNIEDGRRDQILAAAGDAAGSVTFLGPITARGVVMGLMTSAAALVSAAELEAFPLTPHEAGATACPAILSDIPPHREVAGDFAAFFPLGDADSLATLMRGAVAGEMPRVKRTWPITWNDNARTLLQMARAAASSR